MTAPARLERTLTQADFDRFAALSGDDNPIHVDAAFSAATKFGRTVAHGVLLISILASQVQRLRPGARVVRQDIRFPAPTYAGELMVFEVEPAGEGAFACRVIGPGGVVTCDGVLEVAA